MFIDNDIIIEKITKCDTKNLLELINEFSKVA
jgi:hypothetical protein